MSDAAVEKPSEAGKVGYGNPPVHTRWKPGVSPNPGGKPAKSQNRLQGAFLRRLADDFERFGIYAIARARREDPLGYVKVCATLMPKQLEIVRPLDEIPDEQLDAAITAVRAIFAAQDSGNGAARTGETEPAQALLAVPETV